MNQLWPAGISIIFLGARYEAEEETRAGSLHLASDWVIRSESLADEAQLLSATPRAKAMFHKTTHSLLKDKSPLNKCLMHNQAARIIINLISFSKGSLMKIVIDNRAKLAAHQSVRRNAARRTTGEQQAAKQREATQRRDG